MENKGLKPILHKELYLCLLLVSVDDGIKVFSSPYESHSEKNNISVLDGAYDFTQSTRNKKVSQTVT